MKQITGTRGVSLLECVNPRKNKWSIRWNVVCDEADGLVTYMEHSFPYQPRLEVIKTTIIGWYNEQIQRIITSKFCWKGDLVWLSIENQCNYKSEYDLALQTNGENLPVTFKLGTDEHPVYHTFKTVEELKEFYTAMVAHIRSAQEDGWMCKDSIKWEKYEGK